MRSILLLVIFLFSIESYGFTACNEFSYFRPKSGPFAAINCKFHTAYENKINKIQKTFGEPNGSPIILDLSGLLIFKFRGQQESVDITPENYHYLKAAGHLIFIINLLLSEAPNGPPVPAVKKNLKDIDQVITEALVSLSSLPLTHDEKNMVNEILSHTQAYINSIIKNNYFSKHKFKIFFNTMRSELQKSLRLVSAIELSLLDETINKWLAKLTNDEKKKLRIVSAVSHQSRADEISLQYFTKKFGVNFGAGALYENQVVVLEGKFDEQSALLTLARHELDRAVAKTILGNEEALQKDLLADSAKDYLQKHL